MPRIRTGSALVSDYNAALRLVRRVKANNGAALIRRLSTKGRYRGREVFFVLRDDRIPDSALGIIDGRFIDKEDDR